MFKNIKFVCIFMIIVIIAFSIFSRSDNYKMKIFKENIECNVITKGCKNAKALTVNNKVIYVAYNTYIKKIDDEGKETIIYRNDETIEDIEYYNDSIYIISGNNLIKYCISSKAKKIISSKIPLGGNNLERRLFINDKKLLISISAHTNSGVNEDGTKEVIATKESKEIGTASIYEVDLKDNKIHLYASGIRGVTGADSTNDNNVYAIFQGMENKGIRPVNRDSDYIYKVKKDKNYGFPDFSGGDYITSPKFSFDKLITPLNENQKVKITYKPVMVNSSLNTLKELAIDKDGILLPKNSVFFYDSKNKMVDSLVNENSLIELLKFTDKSDVNDIVYGNDEFLILDGGLGCIFSIHLKNSLLQFQLPIPIWIFIGILVLAITIILVKKGLGI